MRNTCLKLIIVSLLTISFVMMLPVWTFAHSLYVWKNQYPASLANSIYSFGFIYTKHVNGNNVEYFWQNSTTKTYFNAAVTNAFSISWSNLITGTEVSNQSSSIVTIIYDPIFQPENAAAVTTNYLDNGTTHHYSISDAQKPSIKFYRDSKDYSTDDKRILAAHELGHLWGLDDLYNYNTNLDSIYSHSYDFYHATRHDRNAMRIALENYWFNPGTNTVWYYQYSPGNFNMRGDIDQDNIVCSADSRLALRYSVGLETFTDLQETVADVDGNGQITAEDARLILQYATSTITQFPTDNE